MMHHILIAEDEPLIAAFIDKGLRKSGYSTTIAHDGQVAVKTMLANDFDLLLLDLGLPQIDGWQVLEELTQAGKCPSVIIVSARDDLSDRQNSDRFRVSAYITKPFRFGELLACVKQCLSPS